MKRQKTSLLKISYNVGVLVPFKPTRISPNEICKKLCIDRNQYLKLCRGSRTKETPKRAGFIAPLMSYDIDDAEQVVATTAKSLGLDLRLGYIDEAFMFQKQNRSICDSYWVVAGECLGDYSWLTYGNGRFNTVKHNGTKQEVRWSNATRSYELTPMMFSAWYKIFVIEC